MKPYFQNEQITLYHGDCLEIMPLLRQKFDMVLCDLPYGTTSCRWDVRIPFKPLWEQYERIIDSGRAIVLCGSQPFTSALIMSNPKAFKHEYIWFKNVPTGMAQAAYAPMKYHENILVFCDGRLIVFNKEMQEREGDKKECYRYTHYCGESNHVKMAKVKKFYDSEHVNPSSVLLFNVVPNRKGKLHPTQKPVSLFEYLIRAYTKEGDTIIDNCAGSGTTGIACENTGRKAVLIEKEQHYCNVIIKRLQSGS